MAYIDTETLLTMLESNLELILDYMDEESKAKKEAELTLYLESAKEFIEREGINIDDTQGDAQLIVMYANWLYDRRNASQSGYRDSTGAMPRMLRWNLNNRLFSQKVNE